MYEHNKIIDIFGNFHGSSHGWCPKIYRNRQRSYKDRQSRLVALSSIHWSVKERDLGIEDRDWYREYHKERKNNGSAKNESRWSSAKPKKSASKATEATKQRPNITKAPEPLSKSSLLYMSVTLNVILIGSLVYVLYR